MFNIRKDRTHLSQQEAAQDEEDKRTQEYKKNKLNEDNTEYIDYMNLFTAVVFMKRYK